MNSLRKLASKIGIDKAIFFTSLARIIQAAGGVISILFVANFHNRQDLSRKSLNIQLITCR